MSDDVGEGNGRKNNGTNEDEISPRGWRRLTQYFEALADPRRRRALYFLSDYDGDALTVDELAKHVTSMETDYSADTLVKADYASVEQELYHNHLPRLEDYGIVDYDSRSGDVRFHPTSQVFLILLRLSQLVERSS